MRLFNLVLLLVFLTVNAAHAFISTPFGAAEKRVRVRILEKAPGVQIRGATLVGLNALRQEGLEGLNWDLTCDRGSIQWVALNGKKKIKSGLLRSPVLFRPRLELSAVDQRDYRGEIEVRSRGSSCEVIDHLNLESYLKSVVNSEASAQWSEEALAAQVIAARTYAYYQIRSSAAKNAVFDLDANVKDQVYGGAIQENARSSAIVERTQGLILAASRGAHPAPIKAFYHSTCGGETELPEKVWGGKYPGFKRRVACPFCRFSPVYSWRLELSASEIAEAMLKEYGSSDRPAGWAKVSSDLFKAENLVEIHPWVGANQQRTSDLLTLWRGHTGRVALKLSASRFRELVGYSKLKSTWFQVQPQPQSKVIAGNLKNWLFQGRGSGHGVGMCQWGVKEMGAKGYRYASILQHYYPDAILRKLW
jgi:stage II sporulation protein D